MKSLTQRCTRLVDRLGLASPDDIQSITPLTGGVASDIAAIELVDRTIVVKFALKKLRVAADWYAPVERNLAEYRWLEFAAECVPDAVPELLGHDADLQGFAMEYVSGDNWKSLMLDGQHIAGRSANVGETMGKIHAASCAATFEQSVFENQSDFYDLRLEPYLVHTGQAHPDLTARFDQLVEQHHAHEWVVIHGDISPKNILMQNTRPVILDAECATLGDPAFDVAFCLNHLVLKAIHMPELSAALLNDMAALWRTYQPHIIWETRSTLEKRVCELLPALMLARVDGKSPVEYLNKHNQERVRKIAKPLLTDPVDTVEALTARIAAALG